MSYASDHALALADVKVDGAAVTFTNTVQTYSPTAGTHTPTTATVEGWAVRVAGSPTLYDNLGLTESSAPTLLFVPKTYGDFPELGDEVTWGAVKHKVRDVAPVAPDGTAIMARVVVVR